ncbi:MAG: hypothetical protein U1F71_23670 [Verrucomicrobiaceae bacterium]
MSTAPRISAPKPCGTPLPGDRTFKTWHTIASIGFVLMLMASAYLWLPHHGEDGMQRTVIVNEARIRELGIVLREVTDPDHTAIVPAETIQRDQAGEFVFAKDLARPNVFVRKGVIAESRSDGRIRILHGIRTGDQIVISGAERLRMEPVSQRQAAETSGGAPIELEAK